MPYEEAEEVNQLTEEHGRSFISLVAPTSLQRIERIASRAQGFLYCVSSLGVTGARSHLDESVIHFLEEVRKYAHVPLAVGFGISNGAQVKMVAPHCGGFIVGSALIDTIAKQEDKLIKDETKNEGLAEIKKFVNNLQTGL